MEKSIESIWKEGFLNEDALIAPKLNDLYNQKSVHIIDKFKRMFEINLKAILIGSFVVLILSYVVKMFVMGVLMFILLNVIYFVNRKMFKELSTIDKNVSSYEYLKSFSDWIQEKAATNAKMAQYYYPYIFLAMILGFWFQQIDNDGTRLGETLVEWITVNFPDIPMLFGIPTIGIVAVITIAVLLGLMGRKLYRWDVGLIYGTMFKKLEEIIADMEELRG